jgi:hypothetical protein
MLKYNVIKIANDAQLMTAYPFVWFTFCFTNIYQPKAQKIKKYSIRGILVNVLTSSVVVDSSYGLRSC